MSGMGALRFLARCGIALGFAAGLAAFLGVPLPPFGNLPAANWRELSVRLVDPAGNAVPDQTVVVDVPAPSGAAELARTKSDAAGIARVRLELPLRPGTRLGVDLPFAAAPRLSREQIAEALSFARPIALELPASAALAVRVVDERGAPVAESVPIRLHWREPGDVPTSVEHLRGWTSVAHRGSALFPRVAPGRSWRVTAEDPLQRSPYQSFEGAGPQRAGEQREIVLRRLAPWPRWVGTAVDESGGPLSGAALLAAFPTGAGGKLTAGAWTRIACDEGGRFELAQRHAHAGLRRLRLRSADEPQREAELELGAAAAGSSGELGRVVLRPLPMLLSGRVLDADGAPVSSAWIEVATWYEGALDDELEIALPASRCSDALGRFELRARAPSALLLVRAGTHAHALARFAGVPAGTRDLVLRLSRAGELDGRLRCDPGFDPRALRVRLVHADGRACAAAPDAEGVFRFEGLPAGRWTPELEAASGRVWIGAELIIDAHNAPLELDARGKLAEIAPRGPATFAAGELEHVELEDAFGLRKSVDLLLSPEARWIVTAARGPYRLRRADGAELPLEIVRSPLAVPAEGR